MRINSSFEPADILARLDSIVKSMPKGDAQSNVVFYCHEKIDKIIRFNYPLFIKILIHYEMKKFVHKGSKLPRTC